MAHREQAEFCTSIQKKYPELFINKKVIDFGSFDVNGNNRYLFTGGSYLGLDAGPGRNVDIVCLAHEYDAPTQSFDVVISTEMLEHDRYWGMSLQNMCRLLKSGGLLLITCATTGREEHGTIRQEGHWHPAFMQAGFDSYYRNLTEEDFRLVMNCDVVFSEYGFSTNNTAPHFDLYFYGIKK